MYLNDVLGVQRLRLPSSVGALFSPFSVFFGATASSALPNGPTPAPPGRPRGQGPGRGPRGQVPRGQGGGNDRGEALFGAPQRRGGEGGGGFPPMAPPPPAPEEAIESLMNLGFERDRVIRALQSRDNNIEAAANFLLSGTD